MFSSKEILETKISIVSLDSISELLIPSSEVYLHKSFLKIRFSGDIAMLFIAFIISTGEEEK